MLHLVILLLASSCVTLCSHVHRRYYLINVPKGWDEAQSYCRENYTDLATIGSHDDMKRLVTVTEASGVTAESWIGLKETEDGVASWLWSVGETQTSPGLAEYTNWASSPTSSDDCGGMRADGKWLSATCKTTLPFVCQDARSGRVHVVLQEKSWRQAQDYCRLNYTDLASVRSQTENQALQQTIHETVPSWLSLVWMGLFRDKWRWSDQSDSSLRYWESSQPNHDGHCALYRPSDQKWYDRGCSYKRPFYCYNVLEKRKKKIVKVEIKVESSFSDSAVSEAILNQIQQKLDGVKLQWRIQPDGKIFHKKEKKKVTAAC